MSATRNKITPLAFVIVFMCFALSTFVSLWSLRTMMAQNMEELNKLLAADVCDTISAEMSQPVVTSQAMASDRLLMQVLRDETTKSEAECAALIADYLAGIRDGMGYESVYVISEATRRYYTDTGISKIVDPDHSDYDMWYLDFINAHTPWSLDMDVDDLNDNMWTIFVNVRMEDDDGTLLAVCGVGVHMSGSKNLFSKLEREYGVRIHMIDAERMIQASVDESLLKTPIAPDIRISSADEYVFQKLGSNRYVVTRCIDWLGWYLVVESDGHQSRGQFLNVIVLNIGLCVFMMAILIIAMRIIALRAHALENASFRDQSTMLLNRRAFEEEKARMLNEPPPEDFVYMTADVNGLKIVNDTLGHAAGDELIKGAATCLMRAFGTYGSIYRIGGDEFAGILRVSSDRLPQVIESFEKAVAGWSGDKVDRLSISCGYATSKEFPSENFTELSRISDERMYAAKEAHYQKTGKARRRT